MWSCFIVLFMNIYLKNDKGNSMTRAIVLVIDSFGIGYSADAEEFGDIVIGSRSVVIHKSSTSVLGGALIP